MTANIMTGEGTASRKVEGKPFEYRGIWFFVHKSSLDGFLITEWLSGGGFKHTEYQCDIKTAIDSVFDKLGADCIHKQIKKHIEKHGIANEAIS